MYVLNMEDPLPTLTISSYISNLQKSEAGCLLQSEACSLTICSSQERQSFISDLEG